jgi:hypothetical protein
MSTVEIQQRDERIRAVRAVDTINGIEHLEIATANQRTLRVVFVHPLPGEPSGIPAAPAPPLTAGQLRISGGVRITGVRVESVAGNANVLTVVVDRAGDYSTYTLAIVTSPFDVAPPPGFDPALATIDFSFKVECPNDFDCEEDLPAPSRTFIDPPIDYLAKDYASFRRLMIERMGTLMPAWTERNPAGIEMMLAEALAATADQISYFQDAVGTEPYLGTARRRTSLRRIARMLDFRVHDGLNARAWVHLSVSEGGDADGLVLPPGTRIAPGEVDAPVVIPPSQEDAVFDVSTTVFEAMHDQPLWASQNAISIHTWSGAVTHLAAGTTTAALANDPELHLRAGDALLFEEVRSPATGLPADADRNHRQVVRLNDVVVTTDPLDGTPLLLVGWHASDALRFALCVRAELTTEGAPQIVEVGVARGNLVLADHGRTVATGAGLDPAVVPDSPRPYRPRLTERNVTYREPYDHPAAAAAPSHYAMKRDPRAGLAAVSLRDGERNWIVQADLLGSDRFAPVFVTESEHDGIASLRFGDGVHGLRPNVGDAFTAVMRIGNGPGGNVGAESLRRIVTSLNGVLAVRNPLPAEGGVAPESAAEIRRSAPEAFRVQERAVTEQDWADVAARHPEVQRARAQFRWTGSWYTVFVTVDRLGGLPVLEDPVFTGELLAHLDRYRIAGYDLELRAPVFVPLEIDLRVCLAPGHFPADVREALTVVFAANVQPDGTRGFFHPDNFTFGQPLYLSQIYARAMAVDGVASVEALTFQRWGKIAAGELAAGRIVPSSNEILRCDSDPNFPENGLITFTVPGENA